MSSYTVEAGPERTISSRRDFLNLYIPDPYTDRAMPLFFYQTTESPDIFGPNEYSVQSILKHEKRDGKLFFKSQWEGYSAREATWEEASQFFPSYNAAFVQYCEKHHLDLRLSDFLPS
jgi:hypothetical protein